MNRNEWADALIAAMGWAAGVRDGIVAQGYSENSRALRNMLDTTEPWPGATDYNSAGVKNYATTADGIAATKATLENGNYPAVLSAGRVGDATAYVRAIAGSPWGTWSNTRDADNALAIVRGDPSIGLVEVAGTGTEEEAVKVIWERPNGEQVIELPTGHLVHIDPATSQSLLANGWVIVGVSDTVANDAPFPP